MLPRNRSCSGAGGAVPRGGSLPFPLPEPSWGPERGSSWAEAMSPPGEPCCSLGKDWDGSDLLCDLGTPKRIRTVLVPAGPGLSTLPSPWAEKGSGFSDIQRFEGFPWPNSLLPAIIPVTGKGIFFGSHKISEIYREEAGGITTPRGGPGGAWASVGRTSHTGSFATPVLPGGVGGGGVK